MPGTVFIVGTPIGNLGDISERALETLRTVDFIAAEDTRVTIKLLNRFSIKKPLVSCYEHNIKERSLEVVDRVLGGESCAVVTDAGMPCISDPGEVLVALCHEMQVPLAVVPGPSAVVSALAISGLSTARFSFEGFLSVNKKQRKEHLGEIKDQRNTLIFYEAPHKLQTTLQDLRNALGNRRISVTRELTKVYEQVLLTDIDGAIAHFKQTPPKGEFVLVVAGAEKQAPEEYSIQDALVVALRLQADGKSPSQAAKEAAVRTGVKRTVLYEAILQNKSEHNVE